MTNTPTSKEKMGKIDTVIEKVLDTWMKKNSGLAEEVNISLEKLAIYRMATMGRLAEIGMVNWEIKKGKSGKAESFYSINKQSKD